MQRLQKIVNASALATELSHVFCCVLPTIFSVLSLLVGLGVIGAVPTGIVYFHDVIHDWEIPIIIVSGLVIAFGWALHAYARKMDCENMGPEHEVCEPRKRRTAKILVVATVLFLVNATIYFSVHVPMEREHGHEIAHDHHDHHHGHDH